MRRLTRMESKPCLTPNLEDSISYAHGSRTDRDLEREPPAAQIQRTRQARSPNRQMGIVHRPWKIKRQLRNVANQLRCDWHWRMDDRPANAKDARARAYLLPRARHAQDSAADAV